MLLLEKRLLMQKHNSHLKGNKEEFVLEPNMCGHELRFSNP